MHKRVFALPPCVTIILIPVDKTQVNQQRAEENVIVSSENLEMNQYLVTARGRQRHTYNTLGTFHSTCYTISPM